MSGLIELVDNRIFLWMPFKHGNVAKYKSIIGYKWEPETEGQPWSYPVSTSNCLALRSLWGEDLKVGVDLARWYRREMTETRERVAILSEAPKLERIRRTHPDVYRALLGRAWQGPGVEFLSQLNTSGNLDEPGLGKTLMALATLINADKWHGRHLVICPPTAIESTWVDEINRWTPDAKVYPMLNNGRAKRQANIDAFLADEDGARFLIIHPWMLQIRKDDWCGKCKMWLTGPLAPKEHDWSQHWEEAHRRIPKDSKIEWPELYEVKWDSVLADEAHQYMLKLKPPSSANQPQWTNGLRRLTKCMAKDGIRHPMTGTPFRGREERLFGMLHWMDPAKYSSFWGWAEARFDVVEEEHRPASVRYNRPAETHKKVIGLSEHGRKLFYDELDRYFLRRTRSEVRPEDPTPERPVHWVRFNDKQEATYRDFEETSVALIEEGVLEGQGRLSELVRLRQLAFGSWKMEDDQTVAPLPQDSPKIQLLNDMLLERGVFGENYNGSADKVIIVSNFTKILLALEEMYKEMSIPTLAIHGRVTGSRRAEAAKSFQTDPAGPKILLLHTLTGGVSLTLDRYCDDEFLLDESWVHDDQVQVEGRINNRSVKVPRVRYMHRILTRGTIDEGIYLGNLEQCDMQSDILDGRRGNTVALSLIKERASR